MEKHTAVPSGYMTVGELAAKMNVTVRTLQYYDKTGLLPPSAVSEGGRRLYTDKDIIRLHQILSLKYLGFSLEDIRDRLIPLESPAEVAQILARQAADIRRQIDGLQESLFAIEALKTEVLDMQTVDYTKYADIVVNLQMKNDFYWLIKHFDSETLDHIRRRFDKKSGEAFIARFLQLQREAVELSRTGTQPAGERGQQFARAYWDQILEFTGGDPSVLPKLLEMASGEQFGTEWASQQAEANAFIEPALEAYFGKLGINPLEEAK